MPARRPDRDLIVKWKVNIPATTAGRVELMLLDPVLNKPIYAARSKLIEALLENWIAQQSGSEPTHIPSVEELRSIT